MGLNVDLTQMLGLRETVKCPKCGKQTSGYFDDYDIECGHPNPRPGYWELHVHCSTCEHDFTVALNILVRRADEPRRRCSRSSASWGSCGRTATAMARGLTCSATSAHRPEERQDRIAALREALECIRDECQLGAHAAHIIDETIAADDAAASAPLPDQPLAEGSEWCSDGAIVEADGTRVLLSTNAPNGAVIVWIDGEPCWLQNVIALARRKGLV